MTQYDIASNALLATINTYVYFVLVHGFFWDKRRYRQKSFTAIYFLLCAAVSLARRFALLKFSTVIPLVSLLEPLFLFVDIYLLWYCFETGIPEAFFLTACYLAGNILSYLAVKSLLNRLTDMTLAENFPFTAHFKHEMTLIAMAILTFYIFVIIAGFIRRSKRPPKISIVRLFGTLLPTVLYLLGYTLIFPYMVGVVNNDYPFLIGTIMFLINAATWVIHIELDRKNTLLYYLDRHYEEQKLYFSQIKEDFAGIQKRAHDERKHYSHIMGLLQHEEYGRLEDYVASLTGGFVEMGKMVITGNQDIDTVLNAKIAEAEEMGCHIAASGELPKHLKFDPVDCCILLGNCLDNAIHASRETNDRNIDAEFSYHNGMLLIRVQNSHIPRHVPRTGANRGLGLDIMSSVVKKYGGDLKTTGKKSIFTTEILLFSPSGSLAGNQQ